jgi:hypothetical protein
MSQPKKKTRIPRRLNPSLTKALKQYARPVGEIIWASNSLHAAFFQIFVKMLERLGDDTGAQYWAARAIWHTFVSDSAARDMVKNVVEASYVKSTPFFKEFTWVYNETGYLSGRRNDFIHTPMAFIVEEGRLIPNLRDGPERRVLRLDRPDIRRIARALRVDLRQLAFYAFHLATIGLTPQKPSLHRPILRVKTLYGDDGQTPRRRNSPKPTRQRRSSWA